MRVWLVAALFAFGCGSTHDQVDAATSDGSASDAGADEVAVPLPCHTTSDCAADMFCAVCMNVDFPTTCQPRPTCDDAGSERVCACDGLVYANACLANAGGTVPATFASDCPAPQGAFACGHIYCDVGTTYCQSVNGNTSKPDTCPPLPPACVGSTDCACFGDAGTCGTCTYIPDAGFRWSCVID